MYVAWPEGRRLPREHRRPIVFIADRADPRSGTAIMRHLSRRSALRAAGAGLVTPLLARYANAAEFNWRFGHSLPATSPFHQHLLSAAEAIAKRSDGQMQLSIIGEGQLGGPSGLLGQVRGGSLEMTAAGIARLADRVPFCSVPAIGFMFADYARLWPAIDGDLGDLIRLQTRSQLNVEILEKSWDIGFHHITTTQRPVRAATDLTGLRIRTDPDIDEIDLLRSFDVIPITIAIPQLHAALEHHLIDGQESMLAVIQYLRLNGVQANCAMTYHTWDGLFMCISPAAWKRLPDRLRGVVANAFNGVALRQRMESAEIAGSIRTSLGETGMIFTDVDPASFRDSLRRSGHYAHFRSKFGDRAWDVVQKATGAQA
jgi:TRAP-type C4-dicarboxylate transport system substrate-binding protein